jgi:hypothetical protein
VPWLPRICALTKQILEQIDHVVELVEDIMRLCCEILIASYRKSEEFSCLNDFRIHLFRHRETTEEPASNRRLVCLTCEKVHLPVVHYSAGPYASPLVPFLHLILDGR